MDLFVYKLLKKSILHISAGKKITASPSTCLGCLQWSLHSCSTTLGQGRDRRSSAPTPPSGQHKNTSQLPAVMLSTKHSTTESQIPVCCSFCRDENTLFHCYKCNCTHTCHRYHSNTAEPLLEKKLFLTLP